MAQKPSRSAEGRASRPDNGFIALPSTGHANSKQPATKLTVHSMYTSCVVTRFSCPITHYHGCYDQQQPCKPLAKLGLPAASIPPRTAAAWSPRLVLDKVQAAASRGSESKQSET